MGLCYHRVNLCSNTCITYGLRMFMVGITQYIELVDGVKRWHGMLNIQSIINMGKLGYDQQTYWIFGYRRSSFATNISSMFHWESVFTMCLERIICSSCLLYFLGGGLFILKKTKTCGLNRLEELFNRAEWFRCLNAFSWISLNCGSMEVTLW